MKKISSKLILSAIIFATTLNIQAEPAHHAQKAESAAGLQLPDDVKPLLTQEMQMLQKGMMDLMPAIASGQWDKIVEIAKKMESSYIMKQKMTKEQMQALHKSLPAAFIHLDHNFHGYAGMLAHVAEEKKSELVTFYAYKLTESCVQCHSQFAQQKFPAFAEKSTKHSKHH